MSDIDLAIKSNINSKVSRLNTSLPAKIVKYDPKTQKAEVLPLIKLLLKTGESRILPTISNVPVVQPATSKSMVMMPINIGDTVLLMFSQRSLDLWVDTEGQDPVNPDDYRKHHFNDAIAIIGLFTFPQAINDSSKHTLPHDTSDLVIAHNIGTPEECEIRLKSDGSVTMTSILSVGTVAPITNLGVGGNFIARLGDQVQITIPTGSSAGTYTGTITTAGVNTSI